ncbi:MAG TPA: dihydropyrimidinase [Desulfobacterales bacterium]|nr:dihydropyrimidinase [Desulfobacterales bacterium]
MSVLLKNGLVVTSAGSYVADVHVEGDRIKAVGTGLAVRVDETVDCTGKYILPGCIDPHTHIDMPFMGTTSADDWVTGSQAAACGGTTCIVDFNLQGKGESLRDAVEKQKAKAEGKSIVDFSIHPGVTDARPDVIDEVKKAIHEYGTPSFKIFLFYNFKVDDYAMIRLLEETKKHGGLVQVHAESWDIIQRLNEQLEAAGTLGPLYQARAHAVLAEEQAIERCIAAVEFTGSRLYVVHLSSGPGLWRIKQARDRGLHVYAETCPQYLTLTEDRYNEPDWGGAKYVMSPPLRDKASQDALWLGLRDGDVQTIGTDHCPFNFRGQKDMNGKDDYKKTPNGAPGIETMLMLLHSEGVVKGRITLERMVDVVSTSTARMFGLAAKGAVVAGKDADLVVFDPKRKFTISQKRLHQRVDYTPWEGLEVTGMPEVVYSRGKRVAEWAGTQMKPVGEIGRGKFVKREPLAAF